MVSNMSHKKCFPNLPHRKIYSLCSPSERLSDSQFHPKSLNNYSSLAYFRRTQWHINLKDNSCCTSDPKYKHSIMH